MTTCIIVSTLVFFAASGAIACRLTAADCVRERSWTYEKQRLSDSVVLVRQVPRRESQLIPAVEQQLDATLRWTAKPCGSRAFSQFYQAL
jgi:hypothetical protein